jgi:hypothetical protein
MAERIGPEFKSWKALIRSLAERYHDGHFYPMAARVQVSSGLVDQWKRGVVRTPSLGSIYKVASAYNLEPLDLLRFGRPLGGGSIFGRTLPLPPLADVLPLIRQAWRYLWGPGWLCPTPA